MELPEFAQIEQMLDGPPDPEGMDPAELAARLDPGAVDPETLFGRNDSLLRQASTAWDAWAEPRRRRKLIRDMLAQVQYFNVEDPDTGETINEAEAIKGQGRIPWVMNKLRPILRHLEGQFRQNRSERVPFATEGEDQEAVNMMAEALAAVRRECNSRMLDTQGVKEHIVGAYAVRKVTEQYTPEKDRTEVVDDIVHANMFFCNRDFGDRRALNLRLIGEMHDMTWEEVVETFSLGEDGQYDPYREAALKQVYSEASEYRSNEYDADLSRSIGFDEADSISFERAVDPWMCRVYEIWIREMRHATFLWDPATGAYGTLEEMGMSREEVDEENRLRAMMGDFPPIELETRPEREWVRYYLSDQGYVLRREVNPYWHQGHPYSFSLGGFFDGEMFSILLDVVDPQRMLNRLYSQIDAMIGTAAKGLWMVPIESLPEKYQDNPEGFADETAKIGNMLFYHSKKGVAEPKVHNSLAIPAGLFAFMQQQTQFMEELSGVTGATQGLEPKSGTPFSLYAQMVQQAQVGSLEVFETYMEALRMHDVKMIQCILQYWSEPRTVKSGPRRMAVEYDPERTRQLSYDVGLGEITDTATYRMLFEDQLAGLLEARRITLQQYLLESSHPRARALLRLIEQTNQIMQSGGDPALMEQLALAAEQGDPDAFATLMQAQEHTPGLHPVA